MQATGIKKFSCACGSSSIVHPEIASDCVSPISTSDQSSAKARDNRWADLLAAIDGCWPRMGLKVCDGLRAA